jgi:hypothetical protein
MLDQYDQDPDEIFISGIPGGEKHPDDRKNHGHSIQRDHLPAVPFKHNLNRDQKGRCPWQYSENTFILDYRDPTHHQYNQQHNRNEDFKIRTGYFPFYSPQAYL